jgi:hypothetical protein
VYEIRGALESGVDLEQRKANAARRAIDEKMDKVAASGDTAHGFYGFANQPNALSYTIPNGAGGTTEWNDKTGMEMVRDALAMEQYMLSQTSNVEKPDTLVLPSAAFARFSTEPVNDTTDVTALEFFLRVARFIKNVDSWEVLDGAGAGGTDRSVAYRRDPEVLEFVIAQDFEAFPGQERGLEVVFPCQARVGGVTLYYPLAMVYGDGL